MSDEDVNVRATHALWEAVNAAGTSAMRRFLSPDYVRHGSDRDYSRDEWIDVMTERNDAFPDLQSEVIDVVAQGDRVAYRWTSTGTHKGTYLRIPPTGRVVNAEGITISRFEGEAIVEEWASWNKSSVLHSLGVLPII